MFCDKHNIFSPEPFAVVTLDIPGIFLYPNPPDTRSIFPIPPVAVEEEVIYLIVAAAPTV